MTATPTEASRGNHSSPRVLRSMDRSTRTFWLLVAPTLLVLLAVGIYPLVASLILALSRSNVSGATTFVGPNNFVRILADSRFWNALGASAKFSGLAVGGELALGFALAVGIRRRGWETRLVTVFMLPMLIAPVVVGVVWLMLYHPSIGLVNYILRPFLAAPAWLGDANTALPALVLVDIWEWTPFAFLLLRAALLSASVEVEEAARVDGATRFQLLRFVTLPQVAPAIAAVVLIRGIDSLKVFDTIYVMTGGGPGRVTETLGVYIYRTAFEDFNLGYAAALSYVQLALVVVLGMIFLSRVRSQQSTRSDV